MQVEQTRVQAETRRIVRVLATAAISLCLLVSIVQGLTHGWETGLLTGITLAMAIIPEEFPVVLTLFLGPRPPPERFVTAKRLTNSRSRPPRRTR